MYLIGSKTGKSGVTNRLIAALVGAVAGICVVSGETRSGTTNYDMSSLLFQQHPFATTAPLQPVVAVSLPAAQIRARTRLRAADHDEGMGRD